MATLEENLQVFVLTGCVAQRFGAVSSCSVLASHFFSRPESIPGGMLLHRAAFARFLLYANTRARKV